jgi:hypothetical protein
MEGLAPSETKEEITVRALTTLRSFGRTNRGKIMVINLDLLATYQRASWDERP